MLRGEPVSCSWILYSGTFSWTVLFSWISPGWSAFLRFCRCLQMSFVSALLFQPVKKLENGKWLWSFWKRWRTLHFVGFVVGTSDWEGAIISCVYFRCFLTSRTIGLVCIPTITKDTQVEVMVQCCILCMLLCLARGVPGPACFPHEFTRTEAFEVLYAAFQQKLGPT